MVDRSGEVSGDMSGRRGVPAFFGANFGDNTASDRFKDRTMAITPLLPGVRLACKEASNTPLIRDLSIFFALEMSQIEILTVGFCQKQRQNELKTHGR